MNTKNNRSKKLKEPTPDDPISLAEASKLCGLSTDYLRDIAISGRLDAYKIGNIWVTTPKNLEKYIKSRRKIGVYRTDISA
jgi:hypothetical protein